jgi:flagellar biosynthesis protein FlhB
MAARYARQKVSDKPFPPSARRLALARQAGLTAASPVLVAGVACAAVVLALSAGRFALGDAVAAACRGEATLGAMDLARTTLSIAAPIVLAAALAALLAQLAQTRTLWLPRRRIPDAPALDSGPAVRARSTAFDLLATVVIGAVTFGWLWIFAPRIATLVELDPHAMLSAAGALGASLLAALAIAWIALGILDALAHHLALAGSLRMTTAEKRDDDRLAAADPRWARQRALLARDVSAEGAALSTAVATCAVLVLGDDVAVAVAWDATRRPIPTRVAVGRRARSTQLVGLARRHRIPVQRDAALARALADGEGPVPEARWRDLAEILAAVRRAD